MYLKLSIPFSSKLSIPFSSKLSTFLAPPSLRISLRMDPKKCAHFSSFWRQKNVFRPLGTCGPHDRNETILEKRPVIHLGCTAARGRPLLRRGQILAGHAWKKIIPTQKHIWPCQFNFMLPFLINDDTPKWLATLNKTLEQKNGHF